MTKLSEKYPDTVIRGTDSIELLTTSTNVDFVKMTFQCVWHIDAMWTTNYSPNDQIRSAFVYKHGKFKDTYNVLIVFLTLAVNNKGKYITKVERKKYRVNLNSKAICIAWGNQRAFPLDCGFKEINLNSLKAKLFDITSESTSLFQ